MTVSYSDHFWKLLLRWKGSLWKTIYKDLIAFIVLYYLIRILYNYAMTADQRTTFEKLVKMFNSFTEHIPLTFMLGFYVGMVVTRWWDQFQRISWPDSFLYWVSAYIRGNDNETRLIRRTIARYCNLAEILGWRTISIRVLKRFPTLHHMVNIGLMSEEEMEMYESIHIRYDPHKQWFAPLNWVLTILVNAYEDKRVSHVNELVTLLSELQRYRHGFMQLFIYDWITIPLVYTQVAVVATYGYFALCLIGRQFLSPTIPSSSNDTIAYPSRTSGIPHESEVDMYVPIFTLLQFLFYVGWLKVGEDLMNPFGEDDEDFEFNYIIDRNLEMSYMIVDTLHAQLPTLQETSAHLGTVTKVLAHTRASALIADKCPSSHVKSIRLRKEDMELVEADNNNAPDEDEEVVEAKQNWFRCVQRMIDYRRDSRLAPIADPTFL